MRSRRPPQSGLASLVRPAPARASPALPAMSGNEVKVVLLGESGSGKTSIVSRFVTNEFHPVVNPTIGSVPRLPPRRAPQGRHPRARNAVGRLPSTLCPVCLTHALLRTAPRSPPSPSSTRATPFNLVCGTPPGRRDTPLSPPWCADVRLCGCMRGADRRHAFHRLSQYYRNADAALLVFSLVDRRSYAKVSYWAEQLRSNGPENVTLVLVGNKSDLEGQRVRSAPPPSPQQASASHATPPLFSLPSLPSPTGYSGSAARRRPPLQPPWAPSTWRRAR